MIKIRLNPDAATAQLAREAVNQNQGYCPCKLERNSSTHCMCKEFREQTIGLCECGLYEKYEDIE